MNRRNLFLRNALVAIALIALAALLHYGLGPLADNLPANYASETHYAVEDRFRNSPTGDWETTALTNRRVDQSLSHSGDVVIIQGNLHVYNNAGGVLFESSALYGVDSHTRQNYPDYGDTNRTGQFLFPTHVEPKIYTYWDPMFIGARVATYDHTDTLEGMAVYVFRFSGTNMDETAGYSFLTDVPKRYQAHTDGQGTLWIEPTSGVVVDYEEQGTSYFVESQSGKRVADFHTWNGRYTPDTRVAQLRLASDARLRILVLESWLPLALLLGGLVWFGVGLRKMWRATKN